MSDFKTLNEAMEQATDRLFSHLRGMMHDDPKQALELAEQLGRTLECYALDIDQLYSDIDDAGAAIGAWDDEDEDEDEDDE